MSLKIAGGLYKGLRLETPPSSITRPTTELVRDAVFNICQNKVQGAKFLDLYAGSGAMGLEALSRGAQEVIFVEKHPYAVAALKKNIEKLEVEQQTHLYPCDVKVAVKKLQNALIDLVFIDPPFGDKTEELRIEKTLEPLLIALEQGALLQKEAWVLLEFSCYSKKDFSSLPLQHLKWQNTRDYGRSKLHLFKKMD